MNNSITLLYVWIGYLLVGIMIIPFFLHKATMFQNCTDNMFLEIIKYLNKT